jgi:hypothetical protein
LIAPFVNGIGAARAVSSWSVAFPSKESFADGWSRRCAPTASFASTTSIPSRRRSPSGPIPLRSKIAGEPYAPAATTIASALSSPRLVATAPARPPSTTTRSTSVSGRTVRLARGRAASTYAKDAFQRTPSAMLNGPSPIPSNAAGSLKSSSTGRPTSAPAATTPSNHGESSSAP